MRFILGLLNLTMGVGFFYYIIGGVKGLITGRLQLLNYLSRLTRLVRDDCEANSIRVGSSVLFLVTMLLTILTVRSKVPEDPVEELIFSSIAILILVGIMVLALIAVKISEKLIQSSPRHTYSHNDYTSSPSNVSVDCRCNNCGAGYGVSLSLVRPQEVRVLSCRVCPVNRVYTVCSNCSDLHEIQRKSCPLCGAKNMWELQNMVLAG